jgi:hypothetical protein
MVIILEGLRFGLPLEATAEQIWHAFRTCVKEASDGKGGYREDMDRLVQTKELALDFRQRARSLRRNEIGFEMPL